MNVARGFLLTGPLYLILGIVIGFYMSATQDHALAPAHAHINLVGFTLMMVFGLVYSVFPAMAASRLATVHFWLHQVGALVLSLLLVLLFTGNITEEGMFPLAPLMIITILAGVICFLVNIHRNAR